MVTRYVLILLFMLPAALLNAQAHFTVSVADNRTDIELGKPLWLDIQSDSTSPDLRSIDFSALAAQFFVDTKTDITIVNGQQHWRVRLYPYHTGTHTIPALFYSGVASTPLTVNVTDALDPKTGQPMPITTTLSVAAAQTVWVRQQITVLYTIHTQNPRSQFRFPVPPAGKHELTPFILSVTTDAQQNAIHQLGWSIHSTQTGTAHIELPPLQFSSDGVTTHSFYHAPLNIDVQPLPIYVPATMPVGRLHIRNDHSWIFAATNSLAQLQVTLTGFGIPAARLPDIGASLHSATGIHTYPATVTQHERFSAQGIQSEVTYRLPFKSGTQGTHRLEPVNLDYFDPDTGRIITLHLQPLVILSLRTWLLVVLLAGLLAISYRLLKPPVLRLVQRMQRYWLYRKTLQQLRTTTTAQQLRQCIRQFAQAQGLPENVTIATWLATYQRTAPQDINALKHSLNDFFYNKQPTADLPSLRQRLLTL